MSFDEVLQEALQGRGVDARQFQQLCARLMAYGVLARDEGGAEAVLYDQAERVVRALTDYFALSGLKLIHDSVGANLRLYPPGAEIPGLPADEDIEPLDRLRRRFDADFAAAAIALAALYHQAAFQGQLTDAGEALVEISALNIFLATQMHRPQVPAKGARKEIYDELRRQRLVRLPADDDIESADATIAVRRHILGFVTQGALDVVLQGPAR